MYAEQSLNHSTLVKSVKLRTQLKRRHRRNNNFRTDLSMSIWDDTKESFNDVTYVKWLSIQKTTFLLSDS